jgi:hypothetical protein
MVLEEFYVKEYLNLMVKVFNFTISCSFESLLLCLHFIKGDCGGLITEKAGLINTPNYPQFYPDFIQCFWLIQVLKL